MKQNPFSLYDILGYTIPGLLFVFVFFIINLLKTEKIDTALDFFKLIPTIKFEAIILILLISYSLGHFFNFISSITIERFSVWKYGYPSKFLLKLKINKFRKHLETKHGLIWGIALIVLLLPIVLLDILFGNLLGFKFFYTRPMDDHLREVVLFKLNQLTRLLGITKANGISIADAKSVDFFRIVQHFTFENSTNHQAKFTNYVALYGFLRTMTFLMILLFWYTIIHSIIIKEYDFIMVKIAGFSAMISYVFFMAYMKFYRRYTLEGFMVLVVNKDLNK